MCGGFVIRGKFICFGVYIFFRALYKIIILRVMFSLNCIEILMLIYKMGKIRIKFLFLNLVV